LATFGAVILLYRSKAIGDGPFFGGGWGFIFSDWKEAKRPCTLMIAGLLLILAGTGLRLLGFGNLREGFR